MPYSKQHKQETRERILRKAARALREAGLHGHGAIISELMAQAGLTHGGFYAHFPSKDALVAAACARGMAESGEQLFARAASESRGAGLRRVIRSYLGRRHRDTPATGCVLPALAADVARAPHEVRAAFTAGLQEYLDRLDDLMPVADEAVRRDGALLLARAVDNAELSDRILVTSREFYSDAFAAREDGAQSPADARRPVESQGTYEMAEEQGTTGARDGG
jgi:TetR/AcrR family transcriptional repressor of nem operon